MSLRVISLISILNIFPVLGQQSFDFNVFKEICIELSTLEKKYDLNEKINNIAIHRNFENNEYTLDTLSTLTEDENGILEGFNETDLVSILESDSLPVFPLNRNSKAFTILDTINFFSMPFEAEVDGNKFRVIKHIKSSNRKQNLMALYKMKFDDDKLILAFIISEGKCAFINFSFSVRNFRTIKCDTSRYFEFSCAQMKRLCKP